MKGEGGWSHERGGGGGVMGVKVVWVELRELRLYAWS